MKRALLAICLLAICSPQGAGAEPLAVTAVGRALSAEQPELDHVGGLRFRGALEMTSSDWSFGGLSGLEASPDGRRLTMVSDEGSWFVAELRFDERGWLSGLQAVETAAMRGLTGEPLRGKESQDAEAVTALPDGTLLVAFEHEHRLWRYDNGPPEQRQAKAWPSPPGLRSLHANSGLEAMTALSDGRVLAIAQDGTEDDAFPAYLWTDETWESLRYRRSKPFEASGAAMLPNGDLLVLERRFSWLGGLAARLLRVAADDIRPGALLAGEVIANLDPPLINDNWEGIAVARGPRGETLIFLLSDDNFLPIQRNLLVMFELIE